MTTTTTMRPIMTSDELARHKVRDHGRLGCGDGYDDMEIAGRSGWKALSCWGADGWDLGDWPYVAIYIRKADGRWQVQQIVEGDHTIYAFDSQEDAYAAIDYLFIWYGVGREYDQWKAEGLTCESRATLNAGTLRVPEQFRGPYRQRQS